MMPTKRRVSIFLIVLSFMLLAKYMWGQDSAEVVGWDPAAVCYSEPSIGAYSMLVVIFGPIFGVASGLKLALDRHHAAKSGNFFRSRLVSLEL